ncbi:MAG: pyridoxal-phosphate-dependent aminotransferase family protein [Candidatus Humimicrobiaceae bacterium]
MRYLLMIPGPVESPEEIIEAFNGQTVAHYGKEFRDLYLNTAERLSRVLGSKDQWSFLMPGSGSTGLETIGATFCNSREVLIINNGHFGDRLYDVSSKYASSVDQVLFKPGEVIDLEVVENQLKKKKYDLVWMVHVDTSVGILNPLKEAAALAKKYGCEFFTDAIASAPAEEIRMDEWGIDGIATASQKAFSCPAGLGMLTLNEKLVKNIKSYPAPKSWYSDLKVWVDYYYDWNDWHPYPVTLPTNTVRALHKSLEILEAKGVENRFALHKTVSAKIVKAIKLLGLVTFIPENHLAHGLTGVNTMGKFYAPDFVSFIREKFAIQIGGSLDDNMKPVVFRIGHLSEKQCETRNLVSVISALGVFMQSKGLDVPVGKAIEALL